MNAVCSICLDVFKNSQESAYSSKCGHVFHLNCILDWHEKSPTCPDCRKPFTEDEIYKLNFHCEDSSEATAGSEKQFKTLQKELTEKNEELSELQLELAKKNSEMQELEETCRTVIEKVELLSSENDQLKKDLELSKNLKSNSVDTFTSKGDSESASSSIDQNETSNAEPVII